jgi:subtilisin family serine protease
MAAGNEGVQADTDKVPVCLSDVPADKRVDNRILCVGALRHDILADKIAGYSNFGDRVDVYAYESYIDLCPNGTSCSTPAVSGAAAAVAAQYPDLSPEEIKAVLVESAETRTLEVDETTAPKPQGQLIETVQNDTHRMTAYHAADGGGDPAIYANPPAAPPGLVPMRTVKVLDPSTMMKRIMEVAARHHTLNARE